MPAAIRRMLLGSTAALVLAAGVACSQTVAGTAVRAIPGIDDDSKSPVDVDSVLLEQTQMRAITGAGEDLTVIPSMDGKQPVDILTLAESAPEQCRWYFVETQTFGAEIEEFHKTTYQDPPDSSLISQGAAGYRDAATARRAFDDLAGRIDRCGSTSSGALYVGDWTVTADGVQTRTSRCGRDYRVKSAVLVEITFCGYPPTVPDIVMTNVLAKVPA